jgi:hypothetical protein
MSCDSTNYCFQVKGSIGTTGCTSICKAKYILYKFLEGSVVYICEEAQKGILETITIKKVLLNGPRHKVIYVDTYNAIWEENELCDEAVAVAAAEDYLIRRLALIDAALNKCTRACRTTKQVTPPKIICNRK